MLTTEQINSLKQNNISIDAETTQQRTEQVWKSAKSAVKNEITTLADCATATVYRVYKTGSISIKLAIALGQVLNINPYYLTGEADELGEFSEALLLQILEQHGYKELLAEIASPAEEPVKQKRKYTRKAKPAAEEAAAEPEPQPEPEAVPETAAVEEQAPLPDIPEEDLQALLHTLIIRSKLGVTDATDKLAQVTGILVS